MTIEDVREELISILTEIEITGGSMVTAAYKDELKIAIETMRKYQKIEKAYSDYLKYMNPDNLADRIGEVIEDDK